MNIVLTGSVAFDYLMSFPGYFRDHILPDRLDSISLSFLVDSMVRFRGGIAPNIAYTLALFGEKPRLYTTVGEDFEPYRTWLESNGVDTSDVCVVPGEFTASFFVNTDRANAQIASFYPGAMAYASQLSLKALVPPKPDLVMISPNDPEAMKQYVRECPELDIPYFYDPSQQIVRLTSGDLLTGILSAKALFANDYEYALIEKMIGSSPAEAMFAATKQNEPFIVMTCGERGAKIISRQGEYLIPIVPPECIVDPTGVGDAFRGGFLAGYICDLGLETCGRMGALAATFCLEQRGTQGHKYSPEQFVTRFRRYFDDNGELDRLLVNHPH